MSEVKIPAWKKYDYVIAMAIAIIIFLALLYLHGLNFLILAAAAIGISIIFERASRYWERRYKWDDERLIRVSAYASMNTIVSITIVMVGMMFLNIARLLPEFGTNTLLILNAFIIFLVFTLWCAFYLSRGDVS